MLYPNTATVHASSFSPQTLLKQNLPVIAEPWYSNIAGYGLGKSYVHRFRLLNGATCGYLKDTQTVHYPKYSLEKLEKDRQNVEINRIQEQLVSD